jgi:hypothetical protein
MGSRWLNRAHRGDAERRRKAIEFQDSIDERFNLGGSRQDGEHELVAISIAKERASWPASRTRRSSGSSRARKRSQVY